MYRNIEFVIFVAFVKCDTAEADVLCGKYQCRNKHVKHICRYCHCPMSQAGNYKESWARKEQAPIQKLVEKGKLDRLKAMSQQYIQNAWYDVQFHYANKMGIHGACPSEMLHAVLLGIFKYLREIFFKYMGDASNLSKKINGLAQQYGQEFTRQSDRRFPKTSFSNDIAKGKLMGTEYRGVLLIMAAVLRSTNGREWLMRRKQFGGEPGLKDWTLLVELLLEWEAFLCLPRMKKAHVKRLERKNRYIMYMLHQVAKRVEGNGWGIFKYHAILHLVQDMLLYGVPKEVDTGANKSHHKPTKQVIRFRKCVILWFRFALTLFILVTFGYFSGS